MAVTSIHDKEITKTVGYPMLMVSKVSGAIVLVTGGTEGVVVKAAEAFPLGYHSHTWELSRFSPLPDGETVVLSNKWE